MMLSEKADAYLQRLCVEIESRRVGSPGNRAATDLFAGVARSFARRRNRRFLCSS